MYTITNWFFKGRMWLKALVLLSNKYKREDLILVTPNCFLCDCMVCTGEEKGEDGKRLEGHGVFGMLLVPMAAPKEPSVAARPSGWTDSIRVSPCR